MVSFFFFFSVIVFGVLCDMVFFDYSLQACFQIGWTRVGDFADCFSCCFGSDCWSYCLSCWYCFHRPDRYCLLSLVGCIGWFGLENGLCLQEIVDLRIIFIALLHIFQFFYSPEDPLQDLVYFFFEYEDCYCYWLCLVFSIACSEIDGYLFGLLYFLL